MNKKAQTFAVRGFALSMAFFILIIGAFTTIDPLKESLNNVRGSTSLNCPGTSPFNLTAYDLQTSNEKLQKRPVCFVTGLSMVWFIGAFLIALVVWLWRNWK